MHKLHYIFHNFLSFFDSSNNDLTNTNNQIGNTDISAIGNSITAAISSLNNELTVLNTVETIDVTSQLISPLTDYSETFSVILAKCVNTISLTIKVDKYTGPTLDNYGTLRIGQLPAKYRPAIRAFGFAGIIAKDAKFILGIENNGSIYIWRWGQPTSIASGVTIIATATYITAG